MKQCPICFQSYDISENFCANDGSTLSTENSLSSIPITNSRELATQVVSRPLTSQPLIQPKSDSSKWLYLIIGILGAGFLITIIYLLFFDKNNPDLKIESKKSEQMQNEIVSNSQKSEDFTNSSSSANVVSLNQLSDINPSGNWFGDWLSTSGAYLTQKVYLKLDDNNQISGQIEWTLKRTPSPEKMGKIGLSAIEYVRGRYDPSTQTVTFQGYRKDDPNNVLFNLDSYRLKLSNDKLSGLARNGGKWDGRMNLSR